MMGTGLLKLRDDNDDDDDGMAYLRNQRFATTATKNLQLLSTIQNSATL